MGFNPSSRTVKPFVFICGVGFAEGGASDDTLASRAARSREDRCCSTAARDEGVRDITPSVRCSDDTGRTAFSGMSVRDTVVRRWDREVWSWRRECGVMRGRQMKCVNGFFLVLFSGGGPGGGLAFERLGWEMGSWSVLRTCELSPSFSPSRYSLYAVFLCFCLPIAEEVWSCDFNTGTGMRNRRVERWLGGWMILGNCLSVLVPNRWRVTPHTDRATVMRYRVGMCVELQAPGSGSGSKATTRGRAIRGSIYLH